MTKVFHSFLCQNNQSIFIILCPFSVHFSCICYTLPYKHTSVVVNQLTLISYMNDDDSKLLLMDAFKNCISQIINGLFIFYVAFNRKEDCEHKTDNFFLLNKQMICLLRGNRLSLFMSVNFFFKRHVINDFNPLPHHHA